MCTAVNLNELSVKVLKSLLESNSVSYTGVTEKSELVQLLQELIDKARLAQEKAKDEQNQKQNPSASSSSSTQQQQQQQQQQQKQANTSSVDEDENICKICFDAPLNCVMLNCGHLSTCLDW